MAEFSAPQSFVILSQQAWEEKTIGSNIWDIAQVLAKTHQVLVINQALDWSYSFGNKRDKRKQRNKFIQLHNGQHLIQIEKNFWVYTPKRILGSFNWLPDSAFYDWLNHRNGYWLANEIKTIIQRLQWKDYILLNDNDMLRGFYLKELLKPSLYVYYLRDNLLAIKYWHRHGNRLEPLLLNKIDLIASNSLYLTEQASRYNPNSFYIGQGCDLTIFDPSKVNDEPADLKKLPRPRIGYVGALTSIRLDFDLVKTIALQRPDWQIVLMGTTDESFPTKLFQSLPNVTLLEPKPMPLVPTYLAYMDVLINPQTLNEVTIGNYPRKIDEYLAMGKPVVAVKTATMALFKQHVFLAETADEFIKGIENALGNKSLSSTSERINFALEHTWGNSVSKLTNAIDEVSAIDRKLVEKRDEF